MYISLLEYITATRYPSELKNKNVLYHSTDREIFISILDLNILYGSDEYDIGIATSRNRDYMFGHEYGIDYEYSYHNKGDVQFILDRDKIKSNYKIKAFDWEEWKRMHSSTRNVNDYQQSEDKILTDKILDISKYIIGIQFNKNSEIESILAPFDEFNELVSKYNWIIYDEEWKNITHLFKT